MWASMNHPINTIEVFTLSTRPVDIGREDVSLCVMDQKDVLDKKLNEIRVDRGAQSGFREVRKDYELFFQCQLQAQIYHLAYLPAVVFNGEEVVYGVDSLHKAMVLREKKNA